MNYNWKLSEANFTKDKGKVFSCFACGGGSTMGYKLAGFDVIGHNDIDPKMVEVTPIASTSDLIEQHVYHVDADEKKNLLIELVKAQAVEARVLVFTRTKHGADKVVKFLQKVQIKSAAIHGNKSQNARQNALNDFKNKNLKVLVATDIAARGIDIDDLEMVLNYEIPNIPETYVHRIGRTGRAGVKGVAISFCDQTEKNYLKLIQKLTKKELTVKKA